MAPTKDEIANLLQQQPVATQAQSGNPGSILQFGGLEQLFTSNVHISIPGFGIDIRGVGAVDSHADVPSLTDVIDTSRPIQTLPPHVIGGGDDDWAVAILTSKATTKSGHPWDNETVGLIHFTPDGKIDKVKAFVDTKSVSEHLERNK